MKRDSKLSAILHVLLHMAEGGDKPATSETLAAAMQTHPVVLRRLMAGLREAGLVAPARALGAVRRALRTPESPQAPQGFSCNQ